MGCDVSYMNGNLSVSSLFLCSPSFPRSLCCDLLTKAYTTACNFLRLRPSLVTKMAELYKQLDKRPIISPTVEFHRIAYLLGARN